MTLMQNVVDAWSLLLLRRREAPADTRRRGGLLLSSAAQRYAVPLSHADSR